MKIRTFVAAAALILALRAHAGAGVVITGPSSITDFGKSQIADFMSGKTNLNGDALASAFAMANITGYPVGSAILKGMPRFLIGLSASISTGNMRYFDPDQGNKRGLVPVGSVNPVILIGFGITKRLDLMLKLMVYNDSLYQPPLNYSNISIKRMGLYSGGIKLRYNIVKEKEVLPGLFSFGGLTFGASVDCMYGMMKLGGSIEFPLGDVEINDPGPIPAMVFYKPSYSASVDWLVLSAHPEIMLHLNFLVVFDLFTGFGFPFHYGYFNLGLHGSGESYSPDYSGTDGLLGTVETAADMRFRPFYIMPVYILGLELNVYIVRITFETMVNLYNGTDVNYQIGLRTQW